MIGFGFDWIHPGQPAAKIDTPFYVDVSVHIFVPIFGLKLGIEPDQIDEHGNWVGDVAVFGFHIFGLGCVMAVQTDFIFW